MFYFKILKIKHMENLENNKIYVDINDNIVESYQFKHIKLNDKVIVTDGSYMVTEKLKPISGIQFKKEFKYELLTVTKINKSFFTDTSHVEDLLIYQNNCEITGNDGKKYYCSIINIKKFKSI